VLKRIEAIAHRFILKAMAHAIRVDSPFVTAERTADLLGIPRSRANTLIKRARKIASRVAHRNSREGKFVTEATRKSKASTRTRSSKNFKASR
jgi:hypothetical protein